MGTEQVMAVMPNRFLSPAMAYSGLTGLQDTIADITGSYPMPIGNGFCAPSIFGGCPPFGMGPGMPYGYGPGQEYMTMTRSQAMDYENELRTKQLNSGVVLSQQEQDADYRANIYNNMVAEKAGVLRNLIKENNQDQIQAAYEALKEAVAQKIEHDGGGKPTEHQIDTKAKQFYEKAMQANIQDDLHKYGDSPFMSGFYKGLGGVGSLSLGSLFTEKRTATQNIAAIEGTKVPKSEKAKEYAGMAVAAVFTLVGALVLHKGYKAWRKPPTVNVVKEAAKALTPAEKLAKMDAHIKGLESDPRMAVIMQKNNYGNITQLHQDHIDGLVYNLTKDEQLLLDAYKLAHETANDLRNGIAQAQYQNIVSS